MIATVLSSRVFNEDCLPAMKQFPDKYFALAVVDPNYGINAHREEFGRKGQRRWETKMKSWDETIPTSEYFNELFRVSERQIIWGGNYFDLPKTGGWIFWDKERQEGLSYGDGELAWTNFLIKIKKVSRRYSGVVGADNIRIHPTQKPVKLYDWIYKTFLPEGGKVLDSHLGSGSNRIAADRAGNIKFVGYEKDFDYFTAQEKRFKNYKSQQKLF